MFHKRMVELNDAQLSLEKLVKLITGQEDVFRQECASITKGLSGAEKYVGYIITGWENSQAICVGADLAEIRGSSANKALENLWPFLARAGEGKEKFKSQVSAPIRDAATRIQSLRIKAIRTSNAEDAEA